MVGIEDSRFKNISQYFVQVRTGIDIASSDDLSDSK